MVKMCSIIYFFYINKLFYLFIIILKRNLVKSILKQGFCFVEDEISKLERQDVL